MILWDWINAYSLTGGPIPVNSTQELAPVFELRDSQSDGGTARPRAGALPKNIDALLYEFRLGDDTPKAIPTIRIDKGTGPFPAASWQTIEQTLTCGSAPIEPGATIMLARMMISDGGLAQIENPAGDNYVSVRSSNPAGTLPRRRRSRGVGCTVDFVERPTMRLSRWPANRSSQVTP